MATRANAVVTKSPRVRQRSARPGKLRRGPAGEIIMDFVDEATDLGAPEFNVTGVARIKRISPGQIRISKYSQRDDGKIIVFHEVWDYKIWEAAVEAYAQAKAVIVRVGLSDGGERRSERH